MSGCSLEQAQEAAHATPLEVPLEAPCQIVLDMALDRNGAYISDMCSKIKCLA